MIASGPHIMWMKLEPGSQKRSRTSKSTTMAAESPVTVYYWGPNGGMNMYGRSIGIYLTLDQAGVKWENKGKDAIPQGGLGTVAFAMPCVQIDDIIVSQTPAILGILGQKYGLAGKTSTETMKVAQAVLDMNDVFGEHAKFVTNEDRKTQWFTYLEKKLETTGWMGGTKEPTIADFHGVFAFVWVVKKKVDFSAFPKTTKWWAEIKKYPVVAKMFASCVGGRTMIP
jgi:hypothetical protein